MGRGTIGMPLGCALASFGVTWHDFRMNQADDEQTALRIRNFLVELSTDLAPDFVVIGGWAAYA
ncbi:MAG TPA: hypothetical protein DCE44_19470, partial [Verrucomicrobiales bacterium]|nr:hypothetical protein [Verrucomicrobiales bacterium]